MSPIDAKKAYDNCSSTLEYLYDRLDKMQKRKKKIIERLDREIKDIQDEIYDTISARRAIEDCHFKTEEYRDIVDITFDDVT